jgi:hypothetical protein
LLDRFRGALHATWWHCAQAWFVRVQGVSHDWFLCKPFCFSTVRFLILFL